MHLGFYKYHFPFKQPFSTTKDTFHVRRGVSIQLKKNGITAWGEAAPLPGFSSESLDELLQQMTQTKSNIKELFKNDFSIARLNDCFSDQNLCPSLQFGLFTIAAIYLAQQKKRSLHQFLWDDPPESVSLNAVIDLNHFTHTRVKKDLKQGFKTFKIKVANDDHFFDQLKSLRDRYPDIHIRLDANQCWSFAQAARFLQKVEPLDIEYCEEPLKNSTPKSLKKLSRNTTVPIALDESLINSFSLNQAKDLADVLIIKPMMLAVGSSPNKLKNLASDGNQKIILTSSLESGIGRLMTASLAAGLAPNAAHGIATGDILERDLWHDETFISDGSYNLPSLGDLQSLMDFDPEERSLNEITL